MIDSLIKLITGLAGVVFHSIYYLIMLLGLIVLIMIIV